LAEPRKIDPIRETTEEARRQVKTLIRAARYGALATLDPASGAPVATRVALATAPDGAPLVLVSALTAHTSAMLADPRVSLLAGEPGKGDPLAHPRVTVQCRARKLERDTDEGRHAARRYLNRNPKAKLYADFGDFSYFRLEPVSVALNGGFGKAYRMDAADLLTASPGGEGIEAMEQPALDHMNADHRDAIDAIAHGLGGGSGDGWTMTGLDAEGVDLARGDECLRVFFPAPLHSADALRPALVELAKSARAQASSAP
jgi:hypothetical protein